MSTAKTKRAKRSPTDAAPVPAAAADHAPALTGEQLRVLHQVYGIILAHSKPGGTP
ncbi:MAG: hypothetical protein U0X20_00675 [Caldilineaceae bacterium]